jgi:DNA uptake protein ComE-like DNA-binding protein
MWLSMPTPPPQTPESRALALEKAAASRRVRAEAKEKLKMGSLNLAELFAEADGGTEDGGMLAKLKVVSVLESLPGVGKVRARKIMEELEISDSRRIRGLGANQRKALLEKFPD